MTTSAPCFVPFPKQTTSPSLDVRDMDTVWCATDRLGISRKSSDSIAIPLVLRIIFQVLGLATSGWFLGLGEL